MFFFKHRLKIASLRIGKHRIVKNIASLRKVNIAHPYLWIVCLPLDSVLARFFGYAVVGGGITYSKHLKGQSVPDCPLRHIFGSTQS